jgi:hypothetical protein
VSARGHNDFEAAAASEYVPKGVSPMNTMQVERAKDRRALAHEAGLGSISWVSVLGGTCAAYGLAAAVLAIAGGVAVLIHGGSNFSDLSPYTFKVTTGIIVALVLFLAFLFGGYVAGRMARRSGVTNGLGVFVLGVILAVGIGVWVREAGGGPSLAKTLRDVGAPTTWHQWRAEGVLFGIITLAAMLIASIIGGASSERWHTMLSKRALDPTVGPSASRPVEPAERPDAEPSAEVQDSEDRSTWRHLLQH